MNTTPVEIETKIHDMVREVLQLPADRTVGDKEDLIGLGLDSLKSVGLVVELEMAFGILFEDEEMLLQNFSSIGKITDKIMRKTAGGE